MGFGLWKKIKNGLKKAGQWINQNVIQPVSKIASKIVAPIAKFAAPLISAINPAVGAAVGGVGIGADMIGRIGSSIGNTSNISQNPRNELVPLLKNGMRMLK
jgi:hypothetical protein